MSAALILLVEDDLEIAEVVRRYLEREGYEVAWAPDGHRALELGVPGVDLILLDLMIPGPDGLELVRRFRAQGSVPILILSARGEETDRVVGLELGADDYMTKPFSPRELMARVRALLRRARMPSASSLAQAGLVLDSEARRAFRGGQPLELTPREFALLRALMATPGRTFTRDELLDRVWGPEYAGDARRVDAHISKLREKIGREGEASPIRSIWGVGYRFEP